MHLSTHLNIFVILIGLIGISNCAPVDIDNDEIYGLVNNSCSALGRRRRSTFDKDMALREIQYLSGLAYEHYKKLFPNYCIADSPKLPTETNDTMFGEHITTHYTWMLWARAAEKYMYGIPVMQNEDFNITHVDNVLNYIRQVVCYAYEGSELPTLPAPRNSTDPFDYRPLSCAIQSQLVQFSTNALPTPTTVPTISRKSFRKSKQRTRYGKRSAGLPAKEARIDDGLPATNMIEKLKPNAI